ncbi:response regulator transcription factor [Cetobacterium sp. 2A]|uniref:response regulator transcription factor n=1 Tax=Cetobacterium sp. 2A TaxID=2754723 RepID=UPI00163D29E2|nr:response regulator transcription factor [Cetobacterium sp. 2A]MBC2856995.1 response regulator transcription factor [Cetobacterium sp. 2A]
MILLVEDTENIRKLVRVILEKEGLKIEEASDGIEGLKKIISGNRYDLILLDIMMPNMDGLEFIKAVRQISQIPIIFLTALSDEKNQILAYENEADGYIVKPFSKDILVSIVKRFLSKKNLPKKYEGLSLEKFSRRIKINEIEIHLSTKERELLFYLEENIGVVKSRTQILDAVWGYDYFGHDRVVDKHITKLREKIGMYSKFIKTVKLLGYKFEV